MNNLETASSIDSTNRVLGTGAYGYSAYQEVGDKVLAADAHANGTALKTASDCHAAQFNAGLDRVSAQNCETRNILKLDEILKGQSDAEFRTSDRFTALTKNSTDAEFRSLDRQRDLEREIIQNAKDSAKCCCDAQLLAEKNFAAITLQAANNKADTDAKMAEGFAGIKDRELQAALARNTQLETINAINNQHTHC